MSTPSRFDKVIKNVRVVRPYHDGVEKMDLGILDGKFAAVAPEIVIPRTR